MKSFEELCDNAATCCQRKELLDNESIRECIELNIFKPLQADMGELIEEIKTTRHSIQLKIDKLTEENANLQDEIRHWRVKAKCYGNIVHGCSLALEAAGFPIDRFASDGATGSIARAVEAMCEEMKYLETKIERLEMKYVSGWNATDDEITKVLKPPMRMKDDLGREYEIISWEPKLAVDQPATVKVELLIKIPEE